jgi:malonyl-CoA O-methyltransferase
VSAVQETLGAYERWAPIYPPVAHNPLMRVEEQAMLQSWPAAVGPRVLDLACGSGRYSRLLSDRGSNEIVSLDFCMPMLKQVTSAQRVCASMMQLPFKAGAFDGVLSGLAIGHATQLDTWMAEVARVLRKGGTLLYSDFHPEAARAGLTRSFKDENNVTCTVPHQLYDVHSQRKAAESAGLIVEQIQEIRVGVQLREPFPGSESFYQNWQGLPIVLIVRAARR